MHLRLLLLLVLVIGVVVDANAQGPQPHETTWVDHPASFSIADAPLGAASRYEILLPTAYVESEGLLEAMTEHSDLYCLYVATDSETGEMMRLRAYYAFESAPAREHWVTSAVTQRWMDIIEAAGTLRERGEKPRDWGR